MPTARSRPGAAARSPLLTDADVIVLGAGAAGLAAARKLARASLRVLVIEARDRVGGRVCRQTQRGITAELGAEFIHGPAKRTMALLHEAGLHALEPGDETWIVANGVPVRDTATFKSAAAIFERARDLSEDESVDQFLQRCAGDAVSRSDADLARTFVEGFDAADPAIASARAIALEWGSGVDSIVRRPADGYAPLFDRLRDECIAAGVRICTSSRVREIVWERGMVDVHVAGAQPDTAAFRARTAIVTLPVGVLRHRGDATAVTFEPTLSERKRNALRYLEMGSVVKVALWFATPFWETLHGGCYRDAAFFQNESSPFRVYWTQMPLRAPLLIAWIGGPSAAALGIAPPDRLVEVALRGLGNLFGDDAAVRREFAGAATHDWQSDPFSRGAYSYVTVGGDDARAAFAEPVDGTLFFAGEATCTDGQSGTVNGALESGERAAGEVAAVLRAKRTHDD